ncbi:embryogenic cell protein 40 [Dorcoceras hygrometricum]|uniref:Embryogenic cell protein 40 n=1 Tax=Dorcoceras hygrometricum TaxID=472368 RepID=A0A2Z7D8E9_9LAMI|nr:embryogenic cell protein 40 [Dorcoceras hygrometricum]
MADLRDEHGNPIQLSDQYGKPVQLTDEFGNPMHLTGVATTHPAPTAATGFHPQIHEEPEPPPPVQQQEEIQRSSSSSSSSSEDDGQGGRRKKKGLREKIKEKLSVGKHKDKDEAAHSSTPPATTTPESKGATTTLGQTPDHEKKGVIDKIKNMLPGH